MSDLVRSTRVRRLRGKRQREALRLILGSRLGYVRPRSSTSLAVAIAGLVKQGILAPVFGLPGVYSSAPGISRMDLLVMVGDA